MGRKKLPTDERRAKAFSRWVLGQCMMFAAWEFVPREKLMALHKLYLQPSFHGCGAGAARVMASSRCC